MFAWLWPTQEARHAVVICAWAVVAMGLTTVPAKAELVTNRGFESPSFGASFLTYGPGSPQLTGWAIDGAGIVHVGTFWQHASGNHSVELNLFAAGGISQTLATTPGEQYQLSFDMAGQPDIGPAVKQMQVFWDGNLLSTFTVDTTGRSTSNMGWVGHTLLLPPATSSATVLRFFGSVPAIGDGGPALDNVSVVIPAGSPAPDAPEPGSLVLLSLGALGLVGYAWRRRLRAA